MALAQADLDAAVKVWATGALRVDYPNGGGVTYRSKADLESAIGKIAASLGVGNPLTAAITAPPRFSLAQHSRF